MSNPAYLFGSKLANATTFYERTPQDKKKKNPLMRAEAAGENPNAILDASDDDKEIMDKESAAYKFGKSMCQPCDMSKHDRSKYQTGPMRALSAEEAVKPADGGVTETQETEHSEKDIANSGQKTSNYKKAVKGGLGGMFGNAMASAARGLAKSTPTTASATALPKIPPRTAAPKLTPLEMQEMANMNAAGRGFSLPPQRAATPVAVRAAEQNARAAKIQKLEAGGGSPQDLQDIMGPQFREHSARAAGANRPPPPLPPPPPSR